MGLGKTITLLALHLHRQTDPATAGPTLVVCPASLLGNWQREAARFAPSTPVRRYHGGSRHLGDLAGDEIVLVTYGVLRRDREALAETAWSLLAADEAQHVKNPYAVTARELRALPALARVALTGTPVENNLSELWALLDWTTPAFSARSPPSATGTPARSRPARTPRPPSACPSCSVPSCCAAGSFDPGDRARTAGQDPDRPRRVADGRADQPVRGGGPRDHGENRGVRGHRPARPGAEAAHRTEADLQPPCPATCASPRRCVAAAELDLLDELIDTITAEGELVLVFTQYTKDGFLEKHLAEGGIPTLLLHGGTPVAQREDMVDRFQHGEVPVFLLSLKAAGTGLNLTRATHVVHYDRWWNPAVEDQATDRAYRIGQDKPVQVHKLLAEGTVEDKVAKLLESKRARRRRRRLRRGRPDRTVRRRPRRTRRPGEAVMSPSLPGQRRAPARGRHAFAADLAGLRHGYRPGGLHSRRRASVPRTHLRPQGHGRPDHHRPLAISRPLSRQPAAPLPILGPLARPHRRPVGHTAGCRRGPCRHLAALLDGEMPAQLVDAARQAGVPLLPQPTELDPDCSCPDWGYPCKHAAALCYAIAATIDTDPFVLFALRGRSREGGPRPTARTPHHEPGDGHPASPGRDPRRQRLRRLGRTHPQAARPPRTIPPRRRPAGPPTVPQRPVPHRPGTAHGRRSGTHNAAVVRRHHLPAPDPAPGRRTHRRAALDPSGSIT